MSTDECQPQRRTCRSEVRIVLSSNHFCANTIHIIMMLATVWFWSQWIYNSEYYTHWLSNMPLIWNVVTCYLRSGMQHLNVLNLKHTIQHSSNCLLGIMKAWGFQNQPHVSFSAIWQHWLGIAKPKNVFRSTLNPSNKLLWNF